MSKESLFKKIARDIGKTGAINNSALTRVNKKYENMVRAGLGYDQILMDWYAHKLREESAKLWERGDPRLKIDDKGLAGVKEDRKFKTVHETGTSGGGDDAAERTDVENMLTGTNYSEEQRGANPNLNPVYGYQDGVADAIYGGNEVTLNPRVKNMMTYALGDSEIDQRLGRYGFADWSALRAIRNLTDNEKKIGTGSAHRELEAIKSQVKKLEDANNGDLQALRDDGFIENQYYGDITADDIAAILDRYKVERDLSDY